MLPWKKALSLAVTLLFSIALTTQATADTGVRYYGGPAGLMGSGPAGKKAGDIISLQTDTDVATYCSFSSQIVVTRNSILCVYNGK